MMRPPVVKILSRLLLALTLCLGPLGAAAQPARTELPPLDAADTTLTIRTGPDTPEVRLGMSEIEALDTYEMTTTTPWREDPAVFEGVLLRDLLAEYGMSDAPAITVTAENDYQTEIPRAVWAETDIMVATRVNGERINRRQRGPILFMVDSETYESSDILLENHLVWMASIITLTPPD